MSSLRPLSKKVLGNTHSVLIKQRHVTTSTKNSAAALATEATKAKSKRLVFDNRSPSLQDFLAQHQLPLKQVDSTLAIPDQIPYLRAQGQQLGRGKKFYIEVYGCQVRLCNKNKDMTSKCLWLYIDECKRYRNFKFNHD